MEPKKALAIVMAVLIIVCGIYGVYESNIDLPEQTTLCISVLSVLMFLISIFTGIAIISLAYEK